MRIPNNIPRPEISRSTLPALMVAAALASLFAAPCTPYNDDGVVALYLYARGPEFAPPERCLPRLPGEHAVALADAICLPPVDTGTAEFPSALVFVDGADATTPVAALTEPDLGDVAAQVVARLGNAEDPRRIDETPHSHHPVPLLFDPLSEPVFAADREAPASPAASPDEEIDAEVAALDDGEQAPSKATADRTAPIRELASSPAAIAVVSGGHEIADRHAAAEYVAPSPGAEDFFAALPTLRAAAHIREISHKIRPGETISQVFAAAGVDKREIPDWVRAAGRVYDLNRVFAGQQVALFVDSRNGSIQQLSMDVDRETVLVAARRGDKVVAQKQQVPHYRRLRVVGGEISRSLYATAVERGIPERVVSDIAEILGWEFDFATDLHPGATFRVVYEEIVRVDTSNAIAGRVLAVDLNNRGDVHEGYYFTPSEDLRGGYYDRDGNALGRAFLRYPVAYSRISSTFSAARYHPIKKKNVPHYGVDFAASTGTPVVASADGSVTKAGWLGGNGRVVKIRHDRIYESAYAHLSGIAAGINTGTKVKRGQTIGYVGQSGLATGPHLHYAMYKYGKYVDPLKVELPKAQALTGAPLERFLTARALIDSAYAQAGLSDDVLAAATAKAVP